MIWLTLDVGLNWPKASFGTKGEWIGASYTAHKGALTATIPTQRIKKLMDKVSSHPAVTRDDSRVSQLGRRNELGSWHCAQRPHFVTMLYGTVHEAERREDAPAEETKKRPRTLAFVKQVEYPLQ